MKKYIFLITLISTFLYADFTISGNVISDNSKMLSTRNMGIITNIYVKEGDKVKKGQKLLKIDSREIDQKRLQLQSVLAIQNLDLENVKLNKKRYERLYKEDMVSKYELEQLENAYKKLKEVVKITKAQLKEVENQYKYLTIIAPNEGHITNVRYKVGELSIPGHPTVTMTDINDLKVVVEVPELKINKIKKGDIVKLQLENIKGFIQGEIYTIVPELNMISHTSKVKIKILDKNKNILSGQYVKVIFKD